MNRWILVLAAGAAIALSGPANATPGQGAVSLSWDGCTGPVERTVLPGQAYSVYASVLGHSEAFTGYQVTLRLAVAPGIPLPDAWRFDATGCQGPSRLTMDHLMTPTKACPNFLGTAPTEQSKSFEFDPVTGIATSRIAAHYLDSGSNTPNPAQRYFLARWRFDHAASVVGSGTPGVSCGGLEVPICLASVSSKGNAASWTGTNGDEHPWMYALEFLTAQSHPGCPCSSDPCPVPVHNATWGMIKNQYR